MRPIYFIGAIAKGTVNHQSEALHVSSQKCYFLPLRRLMFVPLIQMDLVQVDPKRFEMERHLSFHTRSPAALLRLSFSLAANMVSPHSPYRTNVNMLRIGITLDVLMISS